MITDRIRIEHYSETDYDSVKLLLSEDAEAGEDILRVLVKAPELFRTAKLEDKLVALAQVTEPSPQAYVTVYVAPSMRRRGIATALVRQAESVLREGGTHLIRSSFRAGSPTSMAFARSLGYDPYFSSLLMKRSGGPFPLGELPVRVYKDEDYIATQSFYAKAFHDMRVRVGHFPDSVIAPPSEKERRAWQEDAEDRFVYEMGGEIVAYSHISGNEIGSISVRIDMQSRGIGRKFAMRMCNEIYRRGNADVTLWCVVGNYARKLYDSLGFQETYTMQFVRKSL
ncbi:GNAT family N-acetyltransferase [Paenibacillus ginsengarvi]|uniref:GNAT family N-acetyltransferase n=1 Tax=Paenibacillus ginsengarvi TaxID=400777 RepID=A0A3B0BR76_9BACL|nr:GNAT family N-acetyltransferase [Paenibacillus ginsengarvi]RKN75805.1 GNAT family N-acetyltransferase [Paenibacillus ginsengarvi]